MKKPLVRSGLVALSLLPGLLVACSPGEEVPRTTASPAQVAAAPCDSTPYLSSVTLTDLNKNPVSSISANTNYYLQVNARASSTCVQLNTGGTFTSGGTSSCLDTGYAQPYVAGEVGTAWYRVTSSADANCHFSGTVTPWDSCAGAEPASALNFTLPAGGSCASGRHYTCGYALPGYACDNGRNHSSVIAADLTAAIAACRAGQLPGYPDFCYVIDADGTGPSDASECGTAAATWRPGNSCCNFKGTLSCPAVRHYTCGYALPNFGCNNGRNHASVTAADLTSAIAACHANQPAGYTDFCYVIDADGGTPSDAAQCSAAPASWRSSYNCCNFNGSASCG